MLASLRKTLDLFTHAAEPWLLIAVAVSGCTTVPALALDSDLVVNCLSCEGRTELVIDDIIQIELTGSSADDELSALLYSQLFVEPAGILLPDKGAPGQFRTIGAGKAEIILPVKGAGTTVQSSRGEVSGLSASITVSCPLVVPGNVVEHLGDINQETIWRAQDGHHIVTGVIHIDNASLTIGACAQVFFQQDAALIVGESSTTAAALIIQGSREHPIAFDGAGDPPAIWDGIRLFVSQLDPSSALRWVVLSGARGILDPATGTRAVVDIVGDSCQHYPSNGFEAPLALEGVQIDGCGNTGFRVQDVYAVATTSWQHNAVTGCQGPPISVDAGSLGAVPLGQYTGNTPNVIEVVGGWSGPNYQIWRDPGIPYVVESTIVIAPPTGISDEMRGQRCPSGWEIPSEHLYGGVLTEVQHGVEMQFDTDQGLFVGSTVERWLACTPDPDNLEPCDFSTLPSVRFKVLGDFHDPVRFTSSKECQPGAWIGIVMLPNTRAGWHEDRMRLDGAYQYVSNMFGVVVECAGHDNGLKDCWDQPRRGGIVATFPIVHEEWGGKIWFLEGALLRNNLGYGLVSPFTKKSQSTVNTWGRRLGLPTCFCGNELGAIGPADLPFEDGNCAEEVPPDGELTACPCELAGMRWPE